MATCAQCKSDLSGILPKNAKRKYCSRVCSRKHTIEQYHKRNPSRGIPSGTTGAMNELIVCADLMSSGYSVFRALSPHCSCDVAIMKDDKLLRVEVTTGYRHKSGNVTYPPHKQNGFDVLAIVLHDWTIIYEPKTF